MDMKNEILTIFQKSIEVKNSFISEEKNIDSIANAAKLIINCVRQGGKVIVFGNGGSAADSQHMAAELVVRFEKERKTIPCIALTTDTSILTAMANDYSFDEVFSRQIEAFANPGDIVIAVSTSGNSENVVKALMEAKNRNVKIISLTGRDGGKLPSLSDVMILVKAENTARIQEVHGTVIHALCKIVEDSI